MDVSRSQKDFMSSSSYGMPSAKVKLREGKDNSASNKIKKLRQRISASFGRLTLSKEEAIPESDFEFEPGSLHGRVAVENRMAHSYTSTPSPIVCLSLNGTPDRGTKAKPEGKRVHLLQSLGRSLDDSTARRRDEGYQSISLESSASTSTMLRSRDGDKSRASVQADVLATPTNSSIFSCIPGSHKHLNRPGQSNHHHHHHHHSSLKRAFSMLTSSTSAGHQHQQRHHRREVLEASPSDVELLNKTHDKHKHSSVQRHHSTGDMLMSSEKRNDVLGSASRDSSFRISGSGGSSCVEGGDLEVARVRNGVKLRHHRPRSEGSFMTEGLRNKRASSFGSHSPFGKAHAYEKLEQLGEGSYATVFKGVSLLTNKVVALKEIRLQPEEGTPFTAIREASLLKGLKHANIVTLHDIVHTKESLTFVFEYVHTDLGQYLEKHTGGINPKNVKLFMFQLLRGLLFCHERQILHRDLKPQNLLISEVGELKLADFGLARAKSVPSRTYSNEVVTLWYRPPDVLLGSTDYSTSLDIWGVGCIFTEMITGSATFPGMKDSYDQLDHIWQVFGTANESNWEGVTGLPNYNLEKFGNYPTKKLIKSVAKLSNIPYAEPLAESLLQLQPSKRMDANHALHHKYFFDIPNKLYNLPNVASIFNVPCIRLAPEMGDLLRMRSNHGILPATSGFSTTGQKHFLFQASGGQAGLSTKSQSTNKKSPSNKTSQGQVRVDSKSTNKSASCKAMTSVAIEPSFSFKGPSAV